MSWLGLFEIPGTDVPTPPAGKVRVFVDADGNPAFKDDAGVVHSMVGANGQGVPAGGTTGQVPVKASGADFDTAWTTLDAGSVGAQPANANLTGIAALTPAVDQSAYYNGTAWAAYTVTSAGRTLLAATTQAAQRTALGVADDSLVAHLAGSETFTGAKNFEATGTAPIRSKSTIAQTLMLTRSGANPAAAQNSVVQYALDYTDATSSTMYFGMAADATKAPGFAVGLSANLGDTSQTFFRASGSFFDIYSSPLRSATVYPRTDNLFSIGQSGNRWTQVWAVNSAINTSDARLKTDPRQLRDAEFKAFSAICRLPSVWRWLSRVHGDENCEPEGRAARKHFGPTVQAAVKVFSDHGLEAFENAPFCYDEWPAEEATYDEDGNELTPAREAGSRYSFRKEELLCGMVSALAREIDEKDAEIVDLRSIVSDLVSRVAALEAGRNP